MLEIINMIAFLLIIFILIKFFYNIPLDLEKIKN